jgi:hypothetical protein
MSIRERFWVWRAVRAIKRSKPQRRRYNVIWTWSPQRAFFRDCVRSYNMALMSGDC